MSPFNRYAFVQYLVLIVGIPLGVAFLASPLFIYDWFPNWNPSLWLGVLEVLGLWLVGIALVYLAIEVHLLMADAWLDHEELMWARHSVRVLRDELNNRND